MQNNQSKIKGLFTAFALMLVLIYLLSAQGCESTSESLTMNAQVSGYIMGLYNAPFSGLSVSVGDKTTSTNYFGYFLFPHIDYPYQLTVLDTNNRKCIYIPKRDKMTKNNITIQNYPAQNPGMISSEIIVTYPSGEFTSGGKIIFRASSENEYIGDAGITGGSVDFGMARGTSFGGKLYVLLYTKDNNNHIIKYDKYYASPDCINIGAGETYSLNLSSSDFKPITQQSSYHVDLNPLQNHIVDMRYFYINIGYGFTINNLNNVVFDTFNTNSFDVDVPVGIANDVYPVVGFLSHDASGNSSDIFSRIDVNTALDAPPPPTLVLPVNNSNVDINTELVFNQGLGHVENKFYKLYLIDTTSINQQHSTFEVYLDKEKFNLSELNNIGLGNIKGKTFYWKVELYSGNDINTYFSYGYQELNKFMSQSEQRVLTINP
ncbi:MAG: hypothetical protein PHN88_08735 [Ignavibacteria bacterium]|nr:hypothetical protein [Ignavibacteria bacterium]